MRELRPGLWHWTRNHPQWTEADDRAGHQWGPEVSSYAFALANRMVLIDPVIPEGGLEGLRAGREPVTVLTCPWHARDAQKLEAPLYAPPPELGDPKPLPAKTYTAGEILDLGITALAGLEPIDFVLWIESYRALVFGDTLVDLGNGLELPEDWGPSDVSHPEVLRSLSSLLDLPIELALPTHGAPADRAAFERAVEPAPDFR
jgi:glyoxylase-like metal-dependent hydrolase (beta-lactamase superfamily II)